ncbi:MAG: ATP-binding protein [Anaerolineales bacterium]|jgi:signal transduction histidine kinase
MLFGVPDLSFQAFSNILSTAIKYAPDGCKINIIRHTLLGYQEVTIADNSIDISVKDQESIFVKFSHLGEAALHTSGKTKFKGGGSGLGQPM